MRIAHLAALAFALLPAAALAEHEAGMPEATCIVLAKIGDGATSATAQDDGDALVIPVVLACNHLDGKTSKIRIERVDVSYEILGEEKIDPPKPRHDALRGDCSGDGLSLDVTVLTESQKRALPFRGMTTPLRVEAHLSFRGRQRQGPKKLCFGSMEWEFEVRPGSVAAR